MRSHCAGLVAPRRRGAGRDGTASGVPGAPPPGATARSKSASSRTPSSAATCAAVRPSVRRSSPLDGLQAVPAARRCRPRSECRPAARPRRPALDRDAGAVQRDDRAGRDRRRLGRLERRGRRARRGIAEEAAARFAAEQAGVDHLLLHQRRRIALVAEVGGEDRSVTAKLASWPIRSISSNGPMRKPAPRRQASIVAGSASALVQQRQRSA